MYALLYPPHLKSSVIVIFLTILSFFSSHVFASAQSFGTGCEWQGQSIAEVQGAGDASAYQEQSVQVAGVVTGVFPDLNGFTVQTPDQYHDQDTRTSEGIFVGLEGLLENKIKR